MGDLRCAGVLKAALAALLALGGCASSDTTTSGSPADDAARNRATLECMNVAREVKSSTLSLLHPRFAMSYLRGPMTQADIRRARGR